MKKRIANFLWYSVVLVMVICIGLSCELLDFPFRPSAFLVFIPFRPSTQEWCTQYPKGKTYDEFRADATWRGLHPRMGVFIRDGAFESFYENGLVSDAHCSVTEENGLVVETKY